MALGIAVRHDVGGRQRCRIACRTFCLGDGMRRLRHEGRRSFDRFRRFGMCIFRDEGFGVAPHQQFFTGFGGKKGNDLFAKVIEDDEPEIGSHGNGGLFGSLAFPSTHGAFRVSGQLAEFNLRETNGFSDAADFFGVIGGEDVGIFAQAVNEFAEGCDPVKGGGEASAFGGLGKHDEVFLERMRKTLLMLQFQSENKGY